MFLALFLSALKIHVSPQTKEVLDTFNCFELEFRGEVEMKVRIETMTIRDINVKRAATLFQYFWQLHDSTN